MTAGIPDRVIERLSAYRRVLRQLAAEGVTRVYSHELAAREHVTPAQLRRDLMHIDYAGSPAKGYEVAGLLEQIDSILDPKAEEHLALVGVGHLGKALLAHLHGHQQAHTTVTAFDHDPEKTGRIIHGRHCHPIEALGAVLHERPATTGIICVPPAAAQDVADLLVRAGVRGLVNFAPTRLRVPSGVYVEDVDIAALLEKVAYIARKPRRSKEDPS